CDARDALQGGDLSIQLLDPAFLVAASRLWCVRSLPTRGGKRAADKQKGLPFLEALLVFIRLARLAGFEPTTPWFVAKYS
ncbi:hypothetical protein ABTK40_20805, partial [Acinetobacter baumannii]